MVEFLFVFELANSSSLLDFKAFDLRFYNSTVVLFILPVMIMMVIAMGEGKQKKKL